jgi:hypothetical protein
MIIFTVTEIPEPGDLFIFFFGIPQWLALALVPLDIFLPSVDTTNASDIYDYY